MRKTFAIIILLILLDVIIWRWVFLASKGNNEPELYFFDVGQGDSQMIVLPGDIQILIDGGAGNEILSQLSQNLPPTDRYIDLVIMTHPQLDHFGGLIGVVKNYEIGAFIGNGRKGNSMAYKDLISSIQENEIPHIVLSEGDRIIYKDYILEILSPSTRDLLSGELNDTSLVIMFKAPDFNALYTGDIGFAIEERLANKYDLKADILKVAHHGSKYSSSEKFLSSVKPKISLIGVGKNSYGHPAGVALDRLEKIGSLIFRSDLSGYGRIVLDSDKLTVYSER